MAARIINASAGHRPGLLLLEFDVGRASGETEAGYTFKAGDVLKDAWLDVDTAEVTSGTPTLDLGLNGTSGDDDPDGILDGVATDAATVVPGVATVTTGSNTKFFASTTRGALLQDFQAGTDVDQDEGVAHNKDHVVTSDSPLTYTLGAAHTELVAKGYVVFWRRPTSPAAP